MTLTNLNLKSFDRIYPILIQKYNTLVEDPNANVLDKINQIIDSLNSMGKLSIDVVNNWNNVMAWTMNDGLTTDVSNKLNTMVADGTFDSIFQKDIAPSLGDLTTLQTVDKSNLTNALNEVDNLAKTNQTNIGLVANLQTVDKSSLVNAVNEVDNLAKSNQTNLGNLANLTTTDKSNLVNAVNSNTASLAEITPYIQHITTIEVGIGKAFATVTDAINSIMDNSISKQYCIKVYPGTYQERIILKPYVGVVGVNRESCIFSWNRPVASTTDTQVTSDSMIEMHDDGEYIKNLTINGQNFRYMVHTEFASKSDQSVLIDNCFIEHNGNDSSYTWANPHSWGVGLGVNNTKITITNSKLIGFTNGRALLVHDNASPTGSSFVELENTTFLSDGGNVYGGINFDNYISYTGNIPWYASVNNCHIQTGIDTTTNSNPQRCRISGGGNSMQTYYSADWVDSQAGFVIKNTTGSTIANGTGVKISDDKREIQGIMDGTDYSNYSRFIGFAVEDIPNGSYGRICFKGSIYVLFNGIANYLDQLMLDTNGQVIQYNPLTAAQRPIIGQQIQSASATVGSQRYIYLRENIKDLIPNHVITQGSNVRSGAPGGTPTATPRYLGDIYIDTVFNDIYMSYSLTAWKKISP